MSEVFFHDDIKIFKNCPSKWMPFAVTKNSETYKTDNISRTTKLILDFDQTDTFTDSLCKGAMQVGHSIPQNSCLDIRCLEIQPFSLSCAFNLFSAAFVHIWLTIYC